MPDTPYWQLSEHVHQATRMVSEQLHCDVAEALLRLRIRARAIGETVEETSLDVLDRLIRFGE